MHLSHSAVSEAPPPSTARMNTFFHVSDSLLEFQGRCTSAKTLEGSLHFKQQHTLIDVYTNLHYGKNVNQRLLPLTNNNSTAGRLLRIA